jgi:hypothetical protein
MARGKGRRDRDLEERGEVGKWRRWGEESGQRGEVEEREEIYMDKLM